MAKLSSTGASPVYSEDSASIVVTVIIIVEIVTLVLEFSILTPSRTSPVAVQETF